ncbi:MAG TPA: hypothetical protein VNN79_04945 [Actinomycetota bacterium]|jgi:hypothetical protein|nr:hypothetical protein [Actinomycetota bacterium]
MSMRVQALRSPSRVAGPERSEWRLVVMGVVALLVTFAVLLALALANAPSQGGGADHGSRTVTSRDAGVVRVGGDGQYRFHPLP